jgi:hypothetical protein
MPSSAVRAFNDPDDYTAAVRGSIAELTISGRGRFEAKLLHADVGRLRIDRYSDNLPRIVHSVDIPGHAKFAFRTQPGPSLRRSGVEMLQSNLVRRGGAETFFQQSEGPVSWYTISLPVEDIASVGAAIAGCDLTPAKVAITVIPSPGALERLHHLSEAAGHLAQHAPAVIAHLEAARGLERALVEALIHCVGNADVGEDRSALRQHSKIMRRFYEATEYNPNEALFVPDLCAVIGTSERTLRACCEE